MSDAAGSPDARLQPPTILTRSKKAAAPSGCSNRLTPNHVFLLLLSLRLINALVTKTFFQPDEYYQSLEPAWQLAFGPSSGAWITWEWRTGLRSSLHPIFFAAIYKAAEFTGKALSLNANARADLLIALPPSCQGCLAALGDYYTWRLAEVVYGPGRSAIATLVMSALSPWQWFCSTRTLSNSLETTLTVAALFFWPWNQVRPAAQAQPGRNASQSASTRIGSTTDCILQQTDKSPLNVELSLLLAATACILRPTNALIWLIIGTHALLNGPGWAHRGTLIRKALICGATVFAAGAVSDRFYYGNWTLPPLKFLYFNVAQNLAVFYGRNRADYYITEGLPLLLTTALPFGMAGMWTALRGRSRGPRDPLKQKLDLPCTERPNFHADQDVLKLFAYVVGFVTTVMSLIAHKEVRFLYPLLPLLHVLCGQPLAQFFQSPVKTGRKAILTALLVLNVVIAVYTTQFHQRGVIDGTHVLRDVALQAPDRNVTAGFLMPCHSTPWRSHLVAPNLHAWALTCEPPLDIPPSERSSYVDEADQFYADPSAWISANMMDHNDGHSHEPAASKREWPHYLVMFEQLKLDPTSRDLMFASKTWGYEEYWRGFNSHWHDDWRRRGDVIILRRTPAEYN